MGHDEWLCYRYELEPSSLGSNVSAKAAEIVEAEYYIDSLRIVEGRWREDIDKENICYVSLLGYHS